MNKPADSENPFPPEKQPPFWPEKQPPAERKDGSKPEERPARGKMPPTRQAGL